jgi:hypothetical protein
MTRTRAPIFRVSGTSMTAPIDFRRERSARWALHPLENAAFSRRTPEADITITFQLPSGDRRSRLRQLLKQSLRLLQVERVEALDEPAVDRGQEIAGLSPLALIAP